jgi:ParB family chromosome partitioning protein
MSEKITYINLNNLITFEDHPFRVCNDEQMRMITESIRKVGILVPAIARPLGDGKYELISGHRRKKASEILGLKTMPVIVKDVDHDIATVMMVDSNLQREDILPSEKAKAYRMKLNAIKRQGARNDLTSDHYDRNKRITSRDIIAESSPDSAAQIQRYIRLNDLIPPLLQMVDEGKLGLTTGSAISFLEEEEQGWVFLTIQSEQSVPSYAQAVRIKKLFQSRKLTEDMILKIMNEQKKPECWNLTIHE